MKLVSNVHTVAADLENRLHGRLVEYYSDPETQRSNLQIVRVRDAAYSRLFVFHGFTAEGRLSIRLVVKVYKGDDQLTFAHRQFNSLNLLWRDFREQERLKIPRPLDLFSDLPAIVMEEVRGVSVQDLIRWSLWRHWTRKKVYTACQLCGEWLRHFHSVTRVAQGSLDAVAKCQSLQLTLAQLMKYGFAVEIGKSLEAKIRRLATVLSEQTDQRSLVHGDFTIDNVLLDSEIATVLDIEGRYQNLIYHDMASFLNSIALMSLSSPVSESIRQRCSNAFMFGYLGHGKYNSSALWFLRVTGLVSAALEVLGRYKQQPLTQLWLKRGFTRLFNGLAVEAPR